MLKHSLIKSTDGWVRGRFLTSYKVWYESVLTEDTDRT